MTFALNPLLEKDTLAVGDLPLSRVLLINDARWPWLILVPRRAGAVELTDLDVADRALLIEEAASAAAFLKAHARADKINVATLGNVIRQFHLHVVARMVGNRPGLVPSGGKERRGPTRARKQGRSSRRRGPRSASDRTRLVAHVIAFDGIV